MKTIKRHGKPAFTLIELMAVITIIVILAGLVVGGMGYVSEKQATSKAKVQIQLLSKALEDYKLDMGTYPSTGNVATASSPNGTGTSAVSLYQALFYEGYDYAKQGSPAAWPTTKATKIYLSDLDPTSTKQGWVDTVTGANVAPPASTTVKDPWGNQYCYRTAKTLAGAVNAATINPDFDLWSMGKDGKTLTGTLSDKSNKDDIKNF